MVFSDTDTVMIRLWDETGCVQHLGSDILQGVCTCGCIQARRWWVICTMLVILRNRVCSMLHVC